jgi:hypothetical protein
MARGAALDTVTSEPKKKGSKSVYTLLAIGMWVIGIGLGFVIPVNSPQIWLPDALLLLGFWPFLCQLKARWLWIVFGLFNLFIGLTLETVKFLPDTCFSFDPKVLAVKIHLAQYHEPFAWMWIGFISALIGFVRVAIASIAWILRRLKKSKQDDT